MRIDRDRDPAGRARNSRPRDPLGRPLPRDGSEPHPDPPALPPAAALQVATGLLSKGRPFQAHEVFEAVWKSVPTGQKAFWRGLAQLAVGTTHAARGNYTGAEALLQRGVETLGPEADGELLAWAAEAIDACHEARVNDQPVELPDWPTLRLPRT